MTGASVIIHCATTIKGDAEATRNLVAAAFLAGCPHLVYVSIVGIDTSPPGDTPRQNFGPNRS